MASVLFFLTTSTCQFSRDQEWWNWHRRGFLAWRSWFCPGSTPSSNRQGSRRCYGARAPFPDSQEKTRPQTNVRGRNVRMMMMTLTVYPPPLFPQLHLTPFFLYIKMYVLNYANTAQKVSYQFLMSSLPHPGHDHFANIVFNQTQQCLSASRLYYHIKTTNVYHCSSAWITTWKIISIIITIQGRDYVSLTSFSDGGLATEGRKKGRQQCFFLFKLLTLAQNVWCNLKK